MEQILITGANGLLGSELRERLSPANNFFCSREDMDITDMDSIRRYVAGKQIKYIINCAASRDAEYLESHYEEAEKISVDGPRNLALIANELGAVLIHISTDYVFDGKKSAPYTEDDATCGLSVYGKVKIAGEKAVLSTAETALVIRTAWLFSSYGKDFVKTIYQLASTKPELKVIYDQVGTPCYAGDLAAAILQILPQIRRGTREIYHYTNEGICSWYDLAYQIVHDFGLNCRVLPIHTGDFVQKAPRPSFSALDKSKIKRDFNLQIRHYSEGLTDCINRVKEEHNVA